MLNKYFLFVLILSLLLFTACVLGAESSPDFPTYLEGQITFSDVITVLPMFSLDGNYGLVACTDTLYHLELNHGRVHGKTIISEDILAFDVGSNSNIYLISANKLVRIEGFDIKNSVDLASVAYSVTVCGSNPVVLFGNGLIAIYDSSNLSLINTFDSHLNEILFIQGFPGLVTIGATDGTLVSYSVPDFVEIVSEKYEGSFLFLRSINPNRLIFSTEVWNEVAVCSPEDLKILEMFTFSETPTNASADSNLSCVYAVLPSRGLEVCLSNGEVAWHSKDFGLNPLVTVSPDCEAALVVNKEVVSLLLR